MTAVFCRNAADRKAATWKAELAPFSRLEFAVSDAAKGIAAAVEQVAAGRHGEADASARRWSTAWTSSTPRWKPTGSWPGTGVTPRRPGRRRRPPRRGSPGPEARASMRGARRARPAPPGGRATAALEQVEHLEAAWRRAHAALELFRPDGRLNDRAAAEAEIAAALPGLPGADWSQGPQLPADTVAAWPSWTGCTAGWSRPSRGAEWREAMAWRWWLRHRRPAASDPSDGAGPGGGSRAAADRAGAGVV